MGLDAIDPGTAKEKRSGLLGSRWFVYVAITLIISASAAAAGWAYIRHDRGLVFTAFTDKDAYSSDEWINATAEFKNYGLDSVHLTFTTSYMAVFAVYTSEGVLVCRFPIICLDWITEVTITLKPGQSERCGITWDQLAYDADTGSEEQVPSGTYYIGARTLSTEFHATAQTSTFTISG